MEQNETIVAQATGPGRGGVGIVRVSGPLSQTIAKGLLGHCPPVRRAEYLNLRERTGCVLDQGIALFFEGPHSFTGEDVLEFQGHGSPVLLDLIIQEILKFPGVRLANPGEFSQRAFLNGKLDLVQAEAIADLVAASSVQATRAAMRSLNGLFSEQLSALSQALMRVRVFAESMIDFSEDTIDSVERTQVHEALRALCTRLKGLIEKTHAGIRVQEGIEIVLVGAPNAGKSCLFNALLEKDRAIVTEIPGTTRDTLRESLPIAGVTMHLTDTAGLHESTDRVEKLGMARTISALDLADYIVVVVDATHNPEPSREQAMVLGSVAWVQKHYPDATLLVVYNKLDLLSPASRQAKLGGLEGWWVSAQTGQGLPELRSRFQELTLSLGQEENIFSARRRHLEALLRTHTWVMQAQRLFEERPEDLDRVAEDLRAAQVSMGEITGQVSSEELLGNIFSTFCVGK